MLIGGSLLLGGGKTYLLNITASVNNYQLLTALIAAGWNGSSPVRVIVTVAAGVVVGSTSTGTAAMSLGVLPAGSSLTLVNNGTISGAGGAGASYVSGSYNTGGVGGPALRAASSVTIVNNGTIAGGGGGGGVSTGSVSGGGSNTTTYCAGGGGGAGTASGSGGAVNMGNQNSNGGGGSATVGGPGGDSGGFIGGKGGNLGAAGAAGTDYYAGAAGAAGNYINGNSYASWTVTGARLGGFS
jgi:hypothetical protein